MSPSPWVTNLGFLSLGAPGLSSDHLGSARLYSTLTPTLTHCAAPCPLVPTASQELPAVLPDPRRWKPHNSPECLSQEHSPVILPAPPFLQPPSPPLQPSLVHPTRRDPVLKTERRSPGFQSTLGFTNMACRGPGQSLPALPHPASSPTDP